jgi:hypothetical protein
MKGFPLGGTVAAVSLWLTTAAANEDDLPSPVESARTPRTAVGVDPSGSFRHDGFFFRVGLSLGSLSAKVESDPNPTRSEQKLSGLHHGADFFVGATPLRGLVLGGFAMVSQTGGWTSNAKIELEPAGETRTADGNTVFVSVGGFGQYYPDPKLGLHVQALFGYGGLDLPDDPAWRSDPKPTGLVLGGGIGYDFFFVDQGSIGPFARFVFASLGATRDGGTTKVQSMVPSLGVTFTLH